MNTKWSKERVKVGSSVAALFLLLLVATHLLPLVSAEWSTTVFEEAIRIEREPDHLDGRAPFNGEEFHIMIESRTNQAINAADVRFTWAYGGNQGPEGGYQFTRINQTAMEVDIPGYPGGYTIQYRIMAYDEKNHPLTSTTYSYTVIENGSWIDTDFENNIILEWGPTEPRNGQDVTINITSRDPLVAIERADLLYTVNIPDQEPVPGVVYFERINSTVMTSSIIPYPAGSKVSFKIDAYDQYFNKITSETILYDYPRPPVLDPVYQGILFIILKDVAEKLPANGATVVFYNDTFSYQTISINGMAFTNETVYQGD
ncbi:MAG: hypothetical protein JXA22_04215, partial [Candidatus Thermoplasmatota archaeon]|nr:hypothetical protein [Candidatus Thermoplasmatota archaeon]